MINAFKHLLSTSKQKKRLITIIYDILAITLALYLSVAVRLGTFTFELTSREYASLAVTIFITIAIFIKTGMYRAVMRYMMLPALGNIFTAVSASAIALAISSFYFYSFVPRSVPLIFIGFGAILLGWPRIYVRNYYDKVYKKQKPNVFIYGAGSTGRELTYALLSGKEYNPAILFDDDPAKIGLIICGVRVHHPNEFEKQRHLYQPAKLLIAINNITSGERLRLLNKLTQWPIELQSVPSVEDIATGRAQVTELKDLDISDLLGRTQVEPYKELLIRNIKHQSVLVTGAGGSIGSELCRQIILQRPSTLVLFELNEYNLYKIDQEIRKTVKALKLNTNIISALGTVQKQKRLQKLMQANAVNTVYHAAAYKHVPIVEENIIEGVRNNVFGTLFCAQAAIEANVKNFTLISTDKAVRPTNIMGATKRLAELVLQALAQKQTQTTFTMVRFGNVLGSSGSVVPLFKKQIKEGGPVTVTHAEITRYFMMIPEAAQLVIQAGAMGINGQVFVLDMGEPVRILDLAKRMILLMGLKPCPMENDAITPSLEDGDIKIELTGLRPGEKLYEELLIGENVEKTSHPKIMTASEEMLDWEGMEQLLAEMNIACSNFNKDKVIELIIQSPCNYISY